MLTLIAIELIVIEEIERTDHLPSSKLLLRTVALAKAIIWRSPTERLFPPLVVISLSRVRRASSPSVLRESKLDARIKASFNVAFESSFCADGS